MNTPVFELLQVSKRYGNASERTALTEANIRAFSGEVIGCIGPSGSGKTTLLLLSCGFLTPTAGRVQLFGENVSAIPSSRLQRVRAANIGIVFQDFRLIDDVSVYQNVLLAASFAGTAEGLPTERVARALARTGLRDLAGERPSCLSQGERQRCALARAIVNRPRLIIADEPTASLDSPRAHDTMSFFREIAKETGACILFATHDARMLPYADSVYTVCDGHLHPTRYDDASIHSHTIHHP